MRLAYAPIAAAIALILGTGCDRERSAATTAAASCNASTVEAVSPDGTTPTVRGSMPGGHLWATFGMPDYPGTPRGSRWVDKHRAIFINIRGKPVKIPFTMTGSGSFKVHARSPQGVRIKPRSGPWTISPDRGSRRPGASWGTVFVFRKVGCWTIEARRGRTHGRLVFLVRS